MENTVKLVYVGWVNLVDNEPGAEFRIVNEDGTLGRSLYFGRKTAKTASIGGVYEVVQTGDTSFQLSSRRYVGQYHDAEKRAEWQLLNRAEVLRAEAVKAEKNDKAVPAALEYLAPLRHIYRSAMPDRRRALEILLLDYLRSVR